jgi:PadR family transcriptional regulator, regulatory protein AphA
LATGDYLSVRQEESGRRRRFYSLTEKGREAVAAWAADPEVAPPQLREEAILKIFAGGDPEPLAESRRAWHEAKREELAGLLREVRKAEDPSLAASERTLMTGVGYHQKMLELLDLFAEGGEPGQI